MINFGYTPVEVTEPELLLLGENYIARPVTLNEESMTNIVLTDTGRKIIPQGSYLLGTSGNSLLVDSTQIAQVAEVTETLASAQLTTNKITVTAKKAGALAYVIDIEKAASEAYEPSISYEASTKTVTISLAVDYNSDVLTTVDEVVNLINNDMVVNSLVVATLDEDADPDSLAVEEEKTTSGGAAQSISVDYLDGVLYHSVDVTDGEATGAMIINGYINIDNMPSEPTDVIKEKLPHIVFARRD